MRLSPEHDTIQQEKDKLVRLYTSPNNETSKNKYYLGPLVFESKGKAREFVKQWLSVSYHDYEVQDKDKEWIYSLLDNHEYKDEILDGHNGRIYLRKNPRCSLYYNIVIGKNDPYQDQLFSYIKCFDHKYFSDHVRLCKQAFRHAIHPQTFACRQRHFANSFQESCLRTGQIIENNELTHIDHQYIPFSLILHNFLHSRKLDFRDIEIDYKEDVYYYLKDDNLKKDWCDYHAQHAILVPVHRDWNLKTGKKHNTADVCKDDNTPQCMFVEF